MQIHDEYQNYTGSTNQSVFLKKYLDFSDSVVKILTLKVFVLSPPPPNASEC